LAAASSAPDKYAPDRRLPKSIIIIAEYTQQPKVFTPTVVQTLPGALEVGETNGHY